MRSRFFVGVFLLAIATWPSDPLKAAPPKRKLLGPNEREAVLASSRPSTSRRPSPRPRTQRLRWDHHVLKSGKLHGVRPVHA